MIILKIETAIKSVRKSIRFESFLKRNPDKKTNKKVVSA